MKRKLLHGLFIIAALYSIKSQTINMNFPHFAGKGYDFILFQGTQKTVYKGVIPSDGKFTLQIPKEYAPYNGMSRWLITGTAEGGGLDMYIPGKDFSVSCTESQPAEENIIYTHNTGNAELRRLNREQAAIVSRYEAMQLSVKAFPPTDPNYSVFQQEYKNQIRAYNSFQEGLKAKTDYISRFLQIVNLTRGLSNRLSENQTDKAMNAEQYITDELDWQTLYTSGHWTSVVNTWLGIHTRLIKKPNQFSEAFQKISNKITSPAIYNYLAETIAEYLSREGEDGYIKAIAPIVTGSGKIARYEGDLAVYMKGVTGTQAPDLVLPKQKINKGKQMPRTLKIADENYRQTLLFFYQSAHCESCDQQLQQLTTKYQQLAAGRIRVITLSADKEEALYKSKSAAFPWKETYCDYKGEHGENFKNYGVTGVPTFILTDSNGKIMSRGASVDF